MSKKTLYIILIILGLIFVCILCCKSKKSNENFTNEEISVDLPITDIFDSSDEVILNDEDPFTSSPGFAFGPGTVGFGRTGSSFGN